MTSDTHRYNTDEDLYRPPADARRDITNEDINKAEATLRYARRDVQTGPPAGFAQLGGLFKVLVVLGWIQLTGWVLGAAIFLISMLLLALAAS